jgi:hypothetical protein
MPNYLSFLRTGSGSDEIEIHLDGQAVEITIQRHWMGSDLKRYKLTCRQHTLSTSFGLFVVESVEGATGKDGAFEVITPDEEEMLLPLVIEYVMVSSSPVYVHDRSQLTMMRPLGYATWNDTFDLVLMVHDFEGRTEKQPMAEICYAIDKKKFAAWSEAAQARQAARESEDAQASLANWNAILGGKAK